MTFHILFFSQLRSSFLDSQTNSITNSDVLFLPHQSKNKYFFSFNSARKLLSFYSISYCCYQKISLWTEKRQARRKSGIKMRTMICKRNVSSDPIERRQIKNDEATEWKRKSNKFHSWLIFKDSRQCKNLLRLSILSMHGVMVMLSEEKSSRKSQ